MRVLSVFRAGAGGAAAATAAGSDAAAVAVGTVVSSSSSSSPFSSSSLSSSSSSSSSSPLLSSSEDVECRTGTGRRDGVTWSGGAVPAGRLVGLTFVLTDQLRTNLIIANKPWHDYPAVVDESRGEEDGMEEEETFVVVTEAPNQTLSE